MAHAAIAAGLNRGGAKSPAKSIATREATTTGTTTNQAKRVKSPPDAEATGENRRVAIGTALRLFGTKCGFWNDFTMPPND